jgi:hypothetical protein
VHDIYGSCEYIEKAIANTPPEVGPPPRSLGGNLVIKATTIHPGLVGTVRFFFKLIPKSQPVN